MFLFVGLFVISAVGIVRSGRDVLSMLDGSGGGVAADSRGRGGDYEYGRLNINVEYQPSGTSLS